MHSCILHQYLFPMINYQCCSTNFPKGKSAQMTTQWKNHCGIVHSVVDNQFWHHSNWPAEHQFCKTWHTVRHTHGSHWKQVLKALKALKALSTRIWCIKLKGCWDPCVLICWTAALTEKRPFKSKDRRVVTLKFSLWCLHVKHQHQHS